MVGGVANVRCASKRYGSVGRVWPGRLPFRGRRSTGPGTRPTDQRVFSSAADAYVAIVAPINRWAQDSGVSVRDLNPRKQFAALLIKRCAFLKRMPPCLRLPRPRCAGATVIRACIPSCASRCAWARPAKNMPRDFDLGQLSQACAAEMAPGAGGHVAFGIRPHSARGRARNDIAAAPDR